MSADFTFPVFSGPALCAETDPDAFFPEKGRTAPEAKAVCARCEIRDECRDWAISTGEPHGVWGELSERERRRLREKGAPAERRGGWTWTNATSRERVRELDRLNWSISEIAADLNVSTRTVHRILARQRIERDVA